MPTTLEKLLSEMEDKKGECLVQFNRLACAFADEEDGAESDGADLGDVEHICASANKSLEDLSVRVQTIRKRRALDAERAKCDAAAIEKASLLEQIESENAKLRAAQVAHAEAVQPLVYRERECDSQISRRDGIEREIRALFDDQDILDREESIRRRIPAVEAAIREQRGLLGRVKQNLDRLVASDQGKSESVDTLAKRERLASEQAKLDSLVADRDELVAEMNAIHQQKLVVQ